LKSRISNKIRAVHPRPPLFSAPVSAIRTILLAIGLLCSAPALAQPGSGARAQPTQPSAPKKNSKPPPVEIVNIDLGWGNVIPGDRWCPAFVWVTSQQNAFSGVLVVEYQQDATQSARMLVPVTTTPGAITPVEVEIALPSNCDHLSFSIIDGRGREQVHWSYRREDNDVDLQMPHIGARGGLLLALSNVTAPIAVEQFQIHRQNEPARKGPQPQPPPDQGKPINLWESVQVAHLKPDHLPMAWTAYESADLVIAKADELIKADPRCRAAIMEWVEAGGRLLVQADPAGNDWRSFLPSGPEGDLVTLEPLQRVAAGPALASIVRGTLPDDPAVGPGRLIHLTEQGKRQGWKVTWEASVQGGDGPAVPDGSAGLLATGPVGLGLVTILGIEPQSLAAATTADATRALWRHAIEGIKSAHIEHVTSFVQEQYYWMYPYEDDDQTAGSIRAALDEAATVPPLGAGVFVAIAACMLLLMLLLGPIDATVLKRLRQRQRSWLTALLWIGLASLAAYLAPRAMRSGQTVLHRLASADVICDKDGIPLRACGSAVTGIFGGRPVEVELQGSPAGTWFRGVSALEAYRQQSRTLFSPLTLPITVQQPDPHLRGTAPEPFSVAQWTFRGLMDQSPLGPAKGTLVGAKVRPNQSGGWDLTLVNVPASVSSASVTLHIGDKAFEVTVDSYSDGTPDPSQKLHDLRGSVAPGSPSATPRHPIVAAPAPAPAAPMYTVPTAQTYSDFYATIPGTRDRARAIEALVDSGHWACVSLRLKDQPPELSISEIPNLEARRASYLRLLTPLD
jgi:hypothetical protein